MWHLVKILLSTQAMFGKMTLLSKQNNEKIVKRERRIFSHLLRDKKTSSNCQCLTMTRSMTNGEIFTMVAGKWSSSKNNVHAIQEDWHANNVWANAKKNKTSEITTEVNGLYCEHKHTHTIMLYIQTYKHTHYIYKIKSIFRLQSLNSNIYI